MLMMFFVEAALTVTDVHNQPNCQRQVGGTSEVADSLRCTILQDLDVFLGEIADELSRGIPHAESYIHQAHIGAEGRRLCL